jgi:hypothetical protein
MTAPQGDACRSTRGVGAYRLDDGPSVASKFILTSVLSGRESAAGGIVWLEAKERPNERAP